MQQVVTEVLEGVGVTEVLEGVGVTEVLEGVGVTGVLEEVEFVPRHEQLSASGSLGSI